MAEEKTVANAPGAPKFGNVTSRRSDREPDIPHRLDQLLVVWAVFVLLGSVYLITYHGLFRSVDELALFSLTESLAQTRSVKTPQLEFTGYHNVVGRLELLHSVLAVPLYWLAVSNERLGNIQTVMLLNVLITSATGAVLFVLLLGLDHAPKRALLAVLIYGLATIAWPYSRSFFREPLAALLLTVATTAWVYWRQTRRGALGALTLSCLVLVVTTKVTAALAWPAFALVYLFESGISWRARLNRFLMSLLMAFLGAILVSFLYTMRTGRHFSTLLRPFASWTEPASVLPRLFGLLFGSGRGLFVFSPVLALALPGAVMLWRRRRTEAILVLAGLAAFLVGYGGYKSWHGGQVWGSRFLIPIVPLLLLPVAEWLSLDRRAWRAVAGVLALLSLLVQLSAATVNYTLQREGGTWEDVTDYVQSPVVQQLALLIRTRFDMLWWHGPVRLHLEQGYLNWRIVLLPSISLLGAAALLTVGMVHLVARARGIHRKRFSMSKLWVGGALTGLLFVAGQWALLVQAPVAMAGYPGVDPAELRQVAQVINRDRDEPHVIVTVSNEFHLNILLNEFKGRFVHHWLSPAQRGGFDELLRPPFPARSLRLIVDRVHMQPDHSGHDVEFWLNVNLHRYFVDWIGSGYEVYSYLYPPDELSLNPVDYRWADGMTMSAYGMAPVVVDPGEPIWLEFHYSAAHQPDVDYDVLVQLLSPDGRFVNGTDGPPQFGATLTSRWLPGKTIVDRRAVFVPVDAQPGRYDVITGFYGEGERQPVFDDDGRLLGTHVDLGQVRVR